ncbi:SIGIR protein, partial [Polypterus senegalus]
MSRILDDNFMADACFLSDIFKHLNDHNLGLQGRDKTVIDLVEQIRAFQVTNLFDNEGTVFFAIFMALWATIFLELWKRHRAREACHWKLYNWDKEEEDLVLEIVNNPQVMPEKYQHSYVSSVIVMFLVSVMIVIFIGLSLGLVVFRVFATVMLSESEWKLLKENANTVAVMLGAVVHYLTITIMTKCHPSGCMTDLFIQMAIIMILKQTLSNIVEFLSPCMVGYVENSLSTVNLEHLDPKHLQNNSNFVNLTYCRTPIGVHQSEYSNAHDASIPQGNANHVAAVIGALTVLLVLVLMTILYVKCRLNVKLWCRDKYEDYDANDGKLYDAYISYVDSANEKKFVNFILKPHLENKYNYKLHLNTGDILPGSEPSAELLMNVSRCRRLIVVLSQSYLEQDWCTNNFKEGLWRLTELCNKPIFILFENQYRLATHPAVQLLREQKRSITLLVWNSKSVAPSSDFWKELVLAMPHKIRYHSTMADPQVFLHDDKDPMLTVNPEYLDCGSDLDPQGDLGVRVPIFKGPPPKVSALPNSVTHVPTEELEQRHSEIDISDLGSRNYGVRTDFYCLVTEEEF